MLTFPASTVSRFRHNNKHLRLVQAFYNYFKLQKIKGQDKAFCDKLYNVDNATAAAMIKSRTDMTQ